MKLYIFFNFIMLQLFDLLDLILIFFYCYLLYLKWFMKLKISFNFILQLFYLSDLTLVLLITVCFIWNNLWNLIIFLISSSFNFLSVRTSPFLPLFILFKIIYEIWFFLISSSNFFICQVWSLFFWWLFILFEIIYKF
jgi:hypothetical protein